MGLFITFIDEFTLSIKSLTKKKDIEIINDINNEMCC